MEIVIVKNADMVATEAARLVARQIIQKPTSLLGLATGSTPLQTYEKLAKLVANNLISFAQAQTYNLDEYVGLQPTHDQSYHAYMRQNVATPLGINAKQMRILDGMAKDANAECAEYEAEIDSKSNLDLQILGIGSNGHIGFNEPDTMFHERTRCVRLKTQTIADNARFFSSTNEVPTKALTVGFGVIMRSKCVVLLATGKKKAKAIADAIEGPVNPMLPASILQLHPNVVFILDEDAASALQQN